MTTQAVDLNDIDLISMDMFLRFPRVAHAWFNHSSNSSQT